MKHSDAILLRQQENVLFELGPVWFVGLLLLEEELINLRDKSVRRLFACEDGSVAIVRIADGPDQLPSNARNTPLPMLVPKHPDSAFEDLALKVHEVQLLPFLND